MLVSILQSLNATLISSIVTTEITGNTLIISNIYWESLLENSLSAQDEAKFSVFYIFPLK